MAGFFGTVASRKADGTLLAAWVAGGPAAGAKALFSAEGDRWSEVLREDGFPAEAAAEISRLKPGEEGIREAAGTRVFLERVSRGRKLVVCGAGHVALCVIRLGVTLGFDVTTVEDREEYAEKAREAGARRVLCRPFPEALDEIPGDAGTAFVIMTREHVHDVECLRRILEKPFAYAGMMGSRSRTEQIRRQMREEGYDAGKTEQVHMPIGLPIGSRTPEEIAVSVAAELIRTMNAADAGEGFPPGMPEELAAMEKAANRRGVLAVITEKNGEAPRRPGTKMLVREDGSTLGTVGGGFAEARILKAAKEMLAGNGGREGRLIRIGMTKGAMYCGGEITVLLTTVQGEGTA